jgi:DNA repair protein RadB
MSDLDKVSTGSYDFNKWLEGGYEKGIITMIAGAPGCGKTNFCILASCSQAKNGRKVIFIDTEGGFSVERIKQIAGESYEEVLKNIFLLEPTSFEEQKKIFFKLLEKVRKEQIGLIVVDGMSMLYRLKVGEIDKSEESNKIREINREVAGQMRALAEISRKQKIPVIITNQVYSSFLSEEQWKKGVERETNIVGGDLFKYWSKCIIELKGGNGKRRAVLLKHRSLPQKEFSFEIFNEGIRKRSWI